MKPQLDELKDLLKDGDQQAQDAQENADNAADEAASAQEVRHLLEFKPWTFLVWIRTQV